MDHLDLLKMSKDKLRFLDFHAELLGNEGVGVGLDEKRRAARR